MRKVLLICVAVWLACYLVCLLSIIVDALVTVSKGEKFRAGMFFASLLECFLAAPLFAGVIIAGSVFDALDYFDRKIGKNNED